MFVGVEPVKLMTAVRVPPLSVTLTVRLLVASPRADACALKKFCASDCAVDVLEGEFVLADRNEGGGIGDGLQLGAGPIGDAVVDPGTDRAQCRDRGNGENHGDIAASVAAK